MDFTKEEMNEVNKLFREIEKLFFQKSNHNVPNYICVFFQKEQNFIYLKIKYRNIDMEIYRFNNEYKYTINNRGIFDKEILSLINYIKNNFELFINKPIEDGKTLNFIFESGDVEQILLERCRRKYDIM
jgi:hypothetical protein